MAMESGKGSTEILILVSGEIAKLKVMESTLGKMVIDTKENGSSV